VPRRREDARECRLTLQNWLTLQNPQLTLQTPQALHTPVDFTKRADLRRRRASPRRRCAGVPTRSSNASWKPAPSVNRLRAPKCQQVTSPSSEDYRVTSLIRIRHPP